MKRTHVVGLAWCGFATSVLAGILLSTRALAGDYADIIAFALGGLVVYCLLREQMVRRIETEEGIVNDLLEMLDNKEAT